MAHAHHECLEHVEPRELGHYLAVLDRMDDLRATQDARQGSRPEGVGLRARRDRAAARRRRELLPPYLCVELTLGELAFAKGMGWPDRPTLTSGGVVRGYHVRTTSYADGCLLLREADSDEDIFVLVVVQPPRCGIVGWVRGRDGKRDEWRRDIGDGHGSVWFVPQASLHRLDALEAVPRRAD